MKNLKHLNKYFLKYKKMWLLGVLYVLISNVLYIFPAQVTSQAIDLVANNIKTLQMVKGSFLEKELFKNLTVSLIIFALVYLVLALIKGFFTYLTRQTIIVMSRHIEFDMKNEIYAHYQTLPLNFYKNNRTGDLMNRISEDVGKVRMYVGPALMYGLNLIVLFLIVIPYMFTVNTKLALFTILPLPILSYSIYKVNYKINSISERIQIKLSGLSTFVQEAFSGIRVIKSFAKEKDFSADYDKMSEAYKQESLNLSKVNAYFFPIISGLIGLSTILTVYFGGHEVIKGNITIGNIAEFIIYVNILTWPVTSLGWITSIVQQAEASQKRINEFLNTHSEIVSGTQKKEILGNISMKNLSLEYPDSNFLALKNITLDIKAGETVAIVGKTGCGKSTLAQLLCRQMDPTEGTIEIDGINLKEYHLGHFRNNLGYVAQDAFLFSDTIRNNITFGSLSVDEDALRRAAKKADVLDNIMGFKDEFDTMLGERGITLSGGQKQRVTIARALVRDPKILLLDDCLSAVDTETEDTILKNLKIFMTDRTTILVSHRTSTVKFADRILVMSGGEIVEEGSHETLMDQKGLYFEMYQSQLDTEKS